MENERLIKDLLNKKLDLTWKLISINKPLTIIAKVISYTFIISYIIFNLLIIVNDKPGLGSSARLLSENTKNYLEGGILENQHVIFSEYLYWLANALDGDFGKENSHSPFSANPIIFAALSHSFKFIGMALVLSLFIVLIFLLMEKIKTLKIMIINPIINFSYFHAVFIYAIITFLNPINIENSAAILFSGAIVISFSGGLIADYYNLASREFKLIINKDYIVFAKHSGFRYYLFGLKDFLISLITITTSRIPTMFGGMIVFELLITEVYSKDSSEGISYVMLDELNSSNYGPIFGISFLCILIFTTLYFSCEELKESIK